MTNIPDMTNDEINEALAVEVMGLRKGLGGVCRDQQYAWFANGNGSIIYWSKEWSPTKNLNQAVECAEKLMENNDMLLFHIQKSHTTKYVVNITTILGEITDKWVSDNNPARALVEAVLMAKRGETE